MLEPKKPGEVDPNDPGAQSGTTQQPGTDQTRTQQEGEEKTQPQGDQQQ